MSSRARPFPLAEARSGAGPAPRTCPPRAAIGHPAVIEAGVCLGGRDAKPGITVYRFANRTPPPARRGPLRTAAPSHPVAWAGIPLLFEGGGDVATVVSKKRIAWANYKIRHTQDTDRRPRGLAPFAPPHSG